MSLVNIYIIRYSSVQHGVKSIYIVAFIYPESIHMQITIYLHRQNLHTVSYQSPYSKKKDSTHETATSCSHFGFIPPAHYIQLVP